MSIATTKEGNTIIYNGPFLDGKLCLVLPKVDTFPPPPGMESEVVDSFVVVYTLESIDGFQHNGYIRAETWLKSDLNLLVDKIKIAISQGYADRLLEFKNSGVQDGSITLH